MRGVYRQSRKSLPKDAQNLYEADYDPMIEFNKKADIQDILKQLHNMQREDFFKAR